MPVLAVLINQEGQGSTVQYWPNCPLLPQHPVDVLGMYKLKSSLYNRMLDARAHSGSALLIQIPILSEYDLFSEQL